MNTVSKIALHFIVSLIVGGLSWVLSNQAAVALAINGLANGALHWFLELNA